MHIKEIVISDTIDVVLCDGTTITLSHTPHIGEEIAGDIGEEIETVEMEPLEAPSVPLTSPQPEKVPV